MDLTAKVKLYAGQKQLDALTETLREANACCNWISEWAWGRKVFDPFKIRKEIYQFARLTFPALNSQCVGLCIRKVAHSYGTSRQQRIFFQMNGAIAFDSRLLSFETHRRTVSIWTVAGRVSMPYAGGDRQDELLEHQAGESDLIWKGGAFYLAANCRLPTPATERCEDVIGCDLGIRNILTDSDGVRYSGAHIKSVRHRYKRLRRKLQAKGTRSCRRKLKKLSGRESRFVRDANHCVSKEIVARAKGTKRGIALEDLTGIRSRTTVGRGMRGALHDWAFYQLRVFIEYKALWAGVLVVIIDQRNTSRECARCGHASKANRPNQWKFLCLQCWFKAHADQNAAWVIRSRGRAVIHQPNVAAA